MLTTTTLNWSIFNMLKNPLCKGSALITLKLENVLRSQILKAD